MFERLHALDLGSEDPDERTNEPAEKQAPVNPLSTKSVLYSNGTVLSTIPEFKPRQQPVQSTRLMPPFGTDFWRVYRNKLRVFGTTEGVCHLAGQATDKVCQTPVKTVPVQW